MLSAHSRYFKNSYPRRANTVRPQDSSNKSNIPTFQRDNRSVTLRAKKNHEEAKLSDSPPRVLSFSPQSVPDLTPPVIQTDNQSHFLDTTTIGTLGTLQEIEENINERQLLNANRNKNLQLSIQKSPQENRDRENTTPKSKASDTVSSSSQYAKIEPDASVIRRTGTVIDKHKQKRGELNLKSGFSRHRNKTHTNGHQSAQNNHQPEDINNRSRPVSREGQSRETVPRISVSRSPSSQGGSRANSRLSNFFTQSGTPDAMRAITPKPGNSTPNTPEPAKVTSSPPQWMRNQRFASVYGKNKSKKSQLNSSIVAKKAQQQTSNQNTDLRSEASNKFDLMSKDSLITGHHSQMEIGEEYMQPLNDKSKLSGLALQVLPVEKEQDQNLDNTSYHDEDDFGGSAHVFHTKNFINTTAHNSGIPSKKSRLASFNKQNSYHGPDDDLDPPNFRRSKSKIPVLSPNFNQRRGSEMAKVMMNRKSVSKPAINELKGGILSKPPLKGIPHISASNHLALNYRDSNELTRNKSGSVSLNQNYGKKVLMNGKNRMGYTMGSGLPSNNDQNIMNNNPNQSDNLYIHQDDSLCFKTISKQSSGSESQNYGYQSIPGRGYHSNPTSQNVSNNNSIRNIHQIVGAGPTGSMKSNQPGYFRSNTDSIAEARSRERLRAIDRDRSEMSSYGQGVIHKAVHNNDNLHSNNITINPKQKSYKKPHRHRSFLLDPNCCGKRSSNSSIRRLKFVKSKTTLEEISNKGDTNTSTNSVSNTTGVGINHNTSGNYSSKNSSGDDISKSHTGRSKIEKNSRTEEDHKRLRSKSCSPSRKSIKKNIKEGMKSVKFGCDELKSHEGRRLQKVRKKFSNFCGGGIDIFCMTQTNFQKAPFFTQPN